MRSARSVRSIRRSEFKHGFAKYLRVNPTDAERKFWNLLRGKQMAQLRFRRQQPIGPYIVDFFCPAAKLIVELDGNQHSVDTKAAYDVTRTCWLEERGYRVMRFDNIEFLKNKADTLERIWLAVKEWSPLAEPPLAVRPSLKGRVD